MAQSVLIIGGGVSGLSAAYELSGLGIDSILIENGPFLGGLVSQFSCKAVDSCQHCGACYLEDIIGKVGASDSAQCFVGANLTDCRWDNGQFHVSLSITPQRILDCTTEEANGLHCPAPGALIPIGSRVILDERRCLYFKDSSCHKCIDSVFGETLKLDVSPELRSMNVDAVLVASGFTPYDATNKPRFGYGKIKGVVTALDIEPKLRNGTLELNPGAKVAFIQCVGSRDLKIDRNYCSRVCCGYALRMSRLLKNKYSADITVFFMDLQSYERFSEKALEKARNDYRMIRAIPSEIRPDAEGKPEVLFSGVGNRTQAEVFDMVVLSVGMSPGDYKLAKILSIERNIDGFLGGEGESVATSTPGIFTAGAAQGPKSIPESVSHTSRAVKVIMDYLNQKGGGAE